MNNTGCKDCSAMENNSEKVETVNSKLKEIKKDLSEGAYMIDVRTLEEYKEGHIGGAVLWSLSDIEGSVNKPEKLEQDTKIYVYCRSGNRSAFAKKILMALGYKKVVDLGGISNVNKIGFEIIK